MRDTELSFEGIETSLSPEQKDLLFVFVRELSLWNKRMNLTGLTSTQRIMDELVADSLMPLPYLPARGLHLDVGSGAGFPAIPIKICKPDLASFLVESNQKKGSFLRHVIRHCLLKNITVIGDRMENLSQSLPHTRFDIITSRAMAPLPRLVGLCNPFLGPGGLLVAFLGSRFEEILRDCEALLKEGPLLILGLKPYTLKNGKSERCLLVLKKEG